MSEATKDPSVASASETATRQSRDYPPVNWRLAARYCEQHGMDDQLCDERPHDDSRCP